jgi:hypothetical protein
VGRPHLVGSSGKHTVPGTVRSKYPLRTPDGKAQAKPNTASVVDAPQQVVRGFDEATSSEQTDRRDAFGTTYTNTDGTETTVVSATPVNYRRSDGRWAPVDSRLIRAGDGWRNGADAVTVRFADSANAAELGRVEFDAGHAFGFGLAGAAAAAGQAVGSAVLYPSALDQTDVRLDAVSGGVKETLVLHSSSAPTVYLFPLRLTGLSAKLAGGAVVLTDSAGRQRAVIPAGSMTDSAAPTPAPARPARTASRTGWSPWAASRRCRSLWTVPG